MPVAERWNVCWFSGLEKSRALPNLKEIAFKESDGLQPVAEFRTEYDAQQAAGKK